MDNDFLDTWLGLLLAGIGGLFAVSLAIIYECWR